MSIYANGFVVLLLVSVLIRFSQIHLQAQPRSEPTQWLDAFNKGRCGQRSAGRPLIIPTFPPFRVGRHTEEADDDDYHDQVQGDDYDRANWNASVERAVWRWQNRASTGFNAMPGEVPWHAQLTVFFGWLGLYYHALCGGVLIHDNLVLTAAHCIIDDGGWRAQRIWVRLGLYNWHEYEGRQWLGYSKYCLPKGYKPGQFKFDDIAVIRLDARANYDKYVQPACLPGKLDLRADQDCMAGGMGISKESDGRSSRHLRVFPVSWCGRKMLPENSDQSCWVTTDQQMYPGSMCQGDSGSGVYCPHERGGNTSPQFTSMGILSNTPKGNCDEGNVNSNYYSDFRLLHHRIMELVDECSK